MGLTTVLELVNNLADYTSTTVRGDRGIEIYRAMRTVGACERTGNSSFERLGTLLAEWRNDTDGPRFALVAQIFASSNITTADCADWRIEKRCRRFK
jgi:hypothetical protein